MKLLAIHTANNPDKAIMMVDIWRIGRPIRELKKHTDWQIDEQPTFIKQFEKYHSLKDFTPQELQKTYDHLKQYDIIWGSYTAFMNDAVMALCAMLSDKEGVKIVMDIDDNMFRINPHNVGWWKAMDHDKTHDIQTYIRYNKYISTTNEILAKELRERKHSEKQVEVIPNFISLDYKPYTPDNGDKVVIGYFGGASHYDDIHETGVTKALEKLMHENKNIYFKAIGMPVEDYIPRKRYEFVGGKRGHAWTNELFPSLNLDISLGPLTDVQFNHCKSDIKWQESSMMGACFVGSNVSPYKDTVKQGVDGLLVDNSEDDWYRALKEVVERVEYRKELAKNAFERVKKDFLLENNWQVIKERLEAYK